MREYIFVFGRDPELSFAEIVSYFISRNIVYEIKGHNKEVAVFLLNEKAFKVNKVISDLGGCVKIGIVISEGDFNELIPYDGFKSNIKYGMSSYGDDYLRSDFEVYLKKWFKEQKIRAQYKKRTNKTLDPRDVSEDMLEFLLYGRYVAKVIARSNPSEYKKRDLERPVNDFMKNTSIRLSKILVNLSQAKKDELLLDPFCGTGVILQEAMLIGSNVVGVDIDEKSAKISQKNCNWINKHYNIKRGFRLFKGSSTNLSSYFSKGSVDAVASEPYMGPFLKNNPSNIEALKISRELEILYSDFLKSLRPILRSGKKLALIVPVFRVNNKKKVKFDFDSMLARANFKIADLGSEIKFPLVYADQKSKIEREIYVLE